MKKILILGLATVLVVGLAVALRFAMEGVNRDYTEVEVTVVTAQTVTKKVLGQRQQVHEVRVTYQGKTWDLENVHGTAGYRAGGSVTAYLADGHLYANIEGVKSSGPMATAYFVCLFGSFIMVGVTATLWSKERRAQRAAAG